MNAADSSLLSRYGGNLPRYTSYPTATQFSDAVGPEDSRAWLSSLPAGQPVSLYLHVPFCDTLCRFCGCNTAVLRNADARAAYAALLHEELRRIITLIGPGRRLTHLQWGGGTPTTLPGSAMRRVMQAIRRDFDIAPDAEISIEVDPRHLPPDYPALLHELGFNRASMGVQDLDANVQDACGRIQSWEQTSDCLNALRGAGVDSINIDLIYGLPRQDTAGVARTARAVASLRPDRLAVFGYAHVPWKQKRQALMPMGDLPGPQARLDQRAAIDAVLRDEGFLPVGLDHYVSPRDSMARAMATGTLRRNFQGYTTDSAPNLIGVGASAISSLPGGMTQNAVSSAAYARLMAHSADTLPVVRGVRLRPEDHVRAAIIEQVMCALRVNLGQVRARYHLPASHFAPELSRLAPMVADGLVHVTGEQVQVTEKGRSFVRHIAAVFDRYLTADSATRHASAL
ncbi:oxygen-independent coproporphyrinogen III oxidase [Komagataeibacter swingsii]|uniref:Coproporphyrinogen-III oxidase n=1 Tax=Komagataeibacter swingsii TaxID=215220 RepID=A0A2V4RKF3_9PROT|nr:oxygen-independent coproporphyrinogen III oxidase [Komagataeibacter swingsii]PYD70276.1 oxygen-independent coproporphyrinogen III oxidase [Komagataeibacter swingsii]GBQ60188.1 coproporphyrinogen III oxidase [Komagataeibacter swingsii DSM 16373]